MSDGTALPAVRAAHSDASPQHAAEADGTPTPEKVPAHVWLMLASLAANLFSGNTQYMGIPVPPDRVLLFAALVLLAMDRDRPHLRWRPVYAVMITLVLWTSWSALTHGTLMDKNGLFALLDRIIVPFAMFTLGPLFFTTARRREMLLRLMTLIGIYLGATAVFEILGPSSLVWPRYIMDPELGILFGRARGPFLSGEPNGMVMALTLFMALTLAARTRGTWRVLSALSAALSLVGVVLAMTRSVWIAVAVAGLVVGWLIPRVRRRLPLIVGGLVALVALVLMLSPSAAGALDERLSMVSSVYDRQNTNAAGLRIVQAHPIFGIGWQKFIDVGTQWVRQADTYPVSNVTIEIHNVFLSRAAETGIPSAVLWVLAVIMGPALALRRIPESGDERTWSLLLIVALCTWLVPSMTSPNPYPLPNNLMWLIGGFAGSRYLVRNRADADTPTVQEDSHGPA